MTIWMNESIPVLSRESPIGDDEVAVQSRTIPPVAIWGPCSSRNESLQGTSVPSRSRKLGTGLTCMLSCFYIFFPEIVPSLFLLDWSSAVMMPLASSNKRTC